MGWYEKVHEGARHQHDDDPDSTDLGDVDEADVGDQTNDRDTGREGPGRTIPRPPGVASTTDSGGIDRDAAEGGGADGAEATGARATTAAAAKPRSRFGLRTLIPKSVIGFAALVFFMGVSSALTGAVLYAYYESRLERTENAVDAFVGGFTEQLEAGKQIIAAAGEEARGQVQQQLRELEKFAASGSSLTSVLEKVVPSVWFVQTLDESGQPSVGSAFVVFSDSDQSFFLTSYNSIRAATVDPGPAIVLRKGDEEIKATLHSWDQPRDLAVLVADKPEIPALTWASGDPPAQIGDRVFIISGLGTAGGSISQGFVADLSASGLQHDAPVGAAYQGGPLLNTNGEVVGVSSRTYAPLGFDPLAVFFSPPIRAACEEVLRCPDGKPVPA